jgi:hypothetical protein
VTKTKYLQTVGEITAKLSALAGELQELIEERDGLRASLKNALQNRPGEPESKEARILRDALANKVGWREEARRALGLFEWIACENCGKQFESGGRKKKKCGEC